MNELARELGYKMGTPKRDYEKERREQILQNIAYMREHIIDTIGTNKKVKVAIGKIVDFMINKYHTQLESGEYKLMCYEDLVRIGKGSIVDEKAGVVIWSERQFIAFEDMTDLV